MKNWKFSLIAAVTIALMILPFVISIHEDSKRHVWDMERECRWTSSHYLIVHEDQVRIKSNAPITQWPYWPNHVDVKVYADIDKHLTVTSRKLKLESYPAAIQWGW